MKKICVVLGILVLAISSVTFAAERSNENPNDYCYSNGGAHCDDNSSYGGCRGGACGWRR